MNLELIKLDAENKDIEHFEKINNEAFPDYERMSFDKIFELASDTNTDVLGIYDGDLPIGFTVLLKNSECGYIYFLAIDSCTRSKGYGSEAIKKLIQMYSDIQIVLDFEEIDDKAENNAQRIRRKGFYLRNGFHETGNYTILNDERFEVVCTGGELRKEALCELLGILHKNRPGFLDVLL